jgi:hypothetical protein
MKELIRSNERQSETVNQGPSEASFDPLMNGTSRAATAAWSSSGKALMRSPEMRRNRGRCRGERGRGGKGSASRPGRGWDGVMGWGRDGGMGCGDGGGRKLGHVAVNDRGYLSAEVGNSL